MDAGRRRAGVCDDARLLAVRARGSCCCGICYTCHGPAGKGTPLAPDLTDGEWLNTDGTLAGIEAIVKAGVPKPLKYPAPMPPMGGANLSAAEIKAVAAYVYSLSQK